MGGRAGHDRNDYRFIHQVAVFVFYYFNLWGYDYPVRVKI